MSVFGYFGSVQATVYCLYFTSKTCTHNVNLYIFSTTNIMSPCFGCEIQTVYSCLNRTEITENRHEKLKPNRNKSEPWQPYFQPAIQPVNQPTNQPNQLSSRRYKMSTHLPSFSFATRRTYPSSRGYLQSPPTTRQSWF